MGDKLCWECTTLYRGPHVAHATLRLPALVRQPVKKAHGFHKKACCRLQDSDLAGDVQLAPGRVAALAERAGFDAKFLDVLKGTTFQLWRAVVTAATDDMVELQLQFGEAVFHSPEARQMLLAAKAKLVHPVWRFGHELHLPQVCELVETAYEQVSTPVMTLVEDAHRFIVTGVEDYIDTGDEAAYEALGAAYPTLRSLRDAIAAADAFTVKLKPYQLATVAWALDRERFGTREDGYCLTFRAHDDSLRGLWLFDNVAYFPRLVADPSDSFQLGANSATSGGGGMIWDEMGTGKTLAMLAVVLAQRDNDAVADDSSPGRPGVTAAVAHPAVESEEVDMGLDVVETGAGHGDSGGSDRENTNVMRLSDERAHCVVSHPDERCTGRPLPAGGTLVVVQLSLAPQWEQEVELRVKHSAMLDEPLVYHGPSRKRRAEQLLDTDIVITTYETLTADKSAAEAQVKTARAAARWRCPGRACAKWLPEARVGFPKPGDVVELGKSPCLVMEVSVQNRRRTLTALAMNARPARKGTQYLADDLFSSHRTFKHHMSATQPARILADGVQCTAWHRASEETACDVCHFDANADLDDFVFHRVCTPPLMRVRWARVVLDESQKLRTVGSKLYQALALIPTRHKWCLSGTPAPKHERDLGGQLTYMDAPEFVCSGWASNYAHVMDRVRQAVSMQAVRHLKADFLDGRSGHDALPDVSSEDIVVDMPHDDAARYAAVVAATLDLVGDMDDAALVRNAPAVLAALAAERRACALGDSKVVDGAVWASGPGPDDATDSDVRSFPKVPAAAINPHDECPVCLEPVLHPVMLPACHHCLCHECAVVELDAPPVHCPICRTVVDGEGQEGVRRAADRIRAALEYQETHPVQAAAADEKHGQDEHTDAGAGAEAEAEDDTPPAAANVNKYTALVDDMRAKPGATVVFSQFSVTLRFLLRRLREDGFDAHALTGDMSRAARTRSLRAFGSGGDTAVLVVAVKAAAYGLNLVRACRVVFLDPVMNPGLEAQAVARVHRLGQTSDVRVLHIVTRNTVETRVREFRTARVPAEEDGGTDPDGVVVIEQATQNRAARLAQLNGLLGRGNV